MCESCDDRPMLLCKVGKVVDVHSGVAACCETLAIIVSYPDIVFRSKNGRWWARDLQLEGSTWDVV